MIYRFGDAEWLEFCANQSLYVYTSSRLGYFGTTGLCGSACDLFCEDALRRDMFVNESTALLSVSVIWESSLYAPRLIVHYALPDPAGSASLSALSPYKRISSPRIRKFAQGPGFRGSMIPPSNSRGCDSHGMLQQSFASSSAVETVFDDWQCNQP